MSRIPINIAELVGNTPLVGLPSMLVGSPAADQGVELFAKLESFNPGGSVKDRIGVAMIEAAEAEGRIEPGRTTIVEATSGNTGIALAFVCAAKGYDLVLTLPQGMSRERESLLRLYGARVDITESLGGMSEAVAAAREHQPDACLLDVNFPQASGLSAIARIHEVSADTKVVMLSGSIDRGMVLDAIARGAQGFVGKEKPIEAIVEALEMAFQGHLAVDPLLLQEIPRPHDAEDRRVGSPDRRVGRSDRRVGHSDRRRPSQS